MKKITFILLALISGTAFAQVGTATVNAELVEALTISSERGLNFGQIIAGQGAETITIAATEESARTISAEANAPGITPTSAQFNITASDYSYSISIPSIDLTGTGVEKMTLTPISSLGETSTGDQTLYVGGSIEIGASQEVGKYSGNVTVTIAYN